MSFILVPGQLLAAVQWELGSSVLHLNHNDDPSSVCEPLDRTSRDGDIMDHGVIGGSPGELTAFWATDGLKVCTT